MDLVSSFENITSNFKIPPDIKQDSIVETTRILDSVHTKQSMLDSLQYSIKIKPLSYVDERKYYTCIDSAYKIYEQVRAQKKPPSKIFAWILANIAMFNWFFKSLSGYVLTGREVERAVDFALRAPYQFMIKNCLGGLIQAFTISLGGIGISYYTGKDIFQYQAIGFYIISLIINLIKVSLKIRSGDITELQSLRPTI